MGINLETNVGFTIIYDKLKFRVSLEYDDKYNYPKCKKRVSIFPDGYNFLLCYGNECANIDFKDQAHVCSSIRNLDYISLHKMYQGDFSLALVDGESIYIYTSPESTLPIFYMELDDIIVVSTRHDELPINVVKDIDVNILSMMLYDMRYLPYKNISILGAGYTLKVANSIVEKEKFYIERNIRLDLSFCSFDDVSEYFLNMMISTLKNKFKTSDKVGVLLSGGIDSALLAYCLKAIGCDVVLYTWSMPTIPTCDEWEYAHLVAQRLDYPHRKIVVDNEEFNFGLLDQSEYNIPLLHNYSRAWKISCEKMAEEGINILISGYGAAIFESPKYSLNTMVRELPFVDAVSECINAIANPFLNFEDIWKKKSSVPERKINFLRSIDYFEENYVNDICNSDYSVHEFNMQEYAQEINIFQKYGIKCIHPYRNSSVMDLAASLPDSCKTRMHRGQQVNKLLLRYSMVNKLPHEIVGRTYPASMTALIQMYIKKYCRNNDIVKSLYPLIEKKIINKEVLEKIMQEERRLSLNAQSLHICLQFCNWIQSQ